MHPLVIKRWVLWAAVAAVLTFAASACGGKTVSLPADFRITAYQGAEELGGETLLFSSLFNKGKPVVLNFWAGLCPPCRQEMPAFQRVYQRYRGKIVLFGLDVGPYTLLGSSADTQALLKELSVTYPAGALAPGTTTGFQVLAAYEVQGMPTTVFLTAEGRIFKTWVGLMEEGQLRKTVEDLLALSGS